MKLITKKKEKLHIRSLSFILYFSLVHNFSILLIWSLTFKYHVNLIPTIISLMKIVDVANG